MLYVGVAALLGFLIAWVFMLTVVLGPIAWLTSTVLDIPGLRPALKAGCKLDVLNWFDKTCDIVELDDAQQRFYDQAEEAGLNEEIRQYWNCRNRPKSEQDSGWCDPTELESGRVSVLGGERAWLTRLYVDAAARYHVSWRVVAALHGAKSEFGAHGLCSEDGVSGGQFAFTKKEWARFRVDAGETTHTDAEEDGCWDLQEPDVTRGVEGTNDATTVYDVPREGNDATGADPRDPVDAIYTAARMLSELGAEGHLTWEKYNGDRASNCAVEESIDGTIYTAPSREADAGGSLAAGEGGAVPVAVEDLGADNAGPPESWHASNFDQPDAEGAHSASGTRYHAAYDLFARPLAPVYAMWDGVITKISGNNLTCGQVFGQAVYIEREDGKVLVFRHVNAMVEEGDAVTAGQQVATVVDWCSDGLEHTHIEIWKSMEANYTWEQMEDPYPVLIEAYSGGGAGSGSGSGTSPTSEWLVPVTLPVETIGDIPPAYFRLYVSAAAKYPGMPWGMLASVGSNETDHGRSPLPGVTSGVNSYGCCAGPMQFSLTAGTWGSQGVDGNGDGKKDVYDPEDAIPAAARYLNSLARGDFEDPSAVRTAFARYYGGEGPEVDERITDAEAYERQGISKGVPAAPHGSDVIGGDSGGGGAGGGTGGAGGSGEGDEDDGGPLNDPRGTGAGGEEIVAGNIPGSERIPWTTKIGNIPPQLRRVYETAAAPHATLDWTLLAAIADMESNHAGTPPGRRLKVSGGLGWRYRLNGSGGAKGMFGLTPVAVRRYGTDGNDDRRVHAEDPEDAAATTARYLAVNGATTPANIEDAVRRFKSSDNYVRQVMRRKNRYDDLVREIIAAQQASGGAGPADAGVGAEETTTNGAPSPGVSSVLAPGDRQVRIAYPKGVRLPADPVWAEIAGDKGEYRIVTISPPRTSAGDVEVGVHMAAYLMLAWGNGWKGKVRTGYRSPEQARREWAAASAAERGRTVKKPGDDYADYGLAIQVDCEGPVGDCKSGDQLARLAESQNIPLWRPDRRNGALFEPIGTKTTRGRGAVTVSADIAQGTNAGGDASSTGDSSAMAEKIVKVMKQEGFEDSPLIPLVPEIITKSVKAGIDPRFIMAIAGSETGFATTGCNDDVPLSNPNHCHNPFGYNVTRAYPSFLALVDIVLETLNGELYRGAGKRTIPQIGNTWAPVGASNDPNNLNSGWIRGVSSFYAKFGGDPSKPVLGEAGTLPQGSGLSLDAGDATGDDGSFDDTLPTDPISKALLVRYGEDEPHSACYVAQVYEWYLAIGEGVSAGGAGGGNIGAQLVAMAKTKLGTPYVWGAKGPDSFDCSGLVYWALNQIGVDAPYRTTQAWWGEDLGSDWTKGTDLSQVQEGDLVLFGSESNVHHMGIAISKTEFIHAPQTGDVVKIAPLAGRSDFVGWIRYAGGAAGTGAPTGPANLEEAVKVNNPQTFTMLPSWAMAGGRAPQEVDTRILPAALWFLQTYNLRVTAARETGHVSHGDGTALDLIPATGNDQAAWDQTAKRAAADIGWTDACGASGVAPACPLKPWVRFVGYNGYPNHGDPAHVGGHAHLHISWQNSRSHEATLRQGQLTPANSWVQTFPVPEGSGSTPSSP